MKFQSNDICSFFLFSAGLQERSENILDMNADQPVHDLNPYVLCSNVLFYYIMQKLVANLIKLLSFIV